MIQHFTKAVSLPLVCLIGFALMPMAGHGQQQIIILESVHDAWTYALNHNMDMANLDLQTEKMSREVKASQSSWRPTISSTISGQRNLKLATTILPGEIFGQPGTTIETQFGQKYNYNAGITISKQYGWGTALDVASAREDLKTADLQHDVMTQDLKGQVAINYYNLIVSRQALEINQYEMTLADSMVALAEHRRAQGVINDEQYNQARINKNRINQAMASNQLLYDQFQSELYLLLGLSGADLLQLPDTLSVDDMVLLNTDLEKDLSLALAEQQVNTSEIGVKLRKSAYYPTVSVLSYFGLQQFRDDFGVSFGNDAWKDYRYVTLSLNIPIYSGRYNNNKLASARKDHEMAQLQLTDQERQSELMDQLLIDRFQSAQQMVAAASENFQLYHENLGFSADKFEQGLISLDAYLLDFEDYLGAESTFLNTLSSYYNYYSLIISRQP